MYYVGTNYDNAGMCKMIITYCKTKIGVDMVDKMYVIQLNRLYRDKLDYELDKYLT